VEHEIVHGNVCFFELTRIPLRGGSGRVLTTMCDQLFEYATQNRMEWQNKGADIVKTWKVELGGNEDHSI
jgi:hypothetical protein